MLHLIKIGEIALKGGNRSYFLKTLRKNIKTALKGCQCTFTGREGRYFLQTDLSEEKTVEDALSKTFGIVAFSKVVRIEKTIEAIEEKALMLCEELLKKRMGTRFKLEVRRQDKSFFLNSYEIACRIGDRLIKKYSELTVDVHKPDWKIHIELREKGLVYGPQTAGPGGLPVRSAGKGVLLLSGGIDSPVAGYLLAKRGVKLTAVYFHAYPFTSHAARDKVISLAKILSPYLCGVDLFVVPFTDVQALIRQKAREEEATLLMRACMMRMAGMIAEKYLSLCLVTGESLSQVASQTLESIRFTGSMSELPVFRPLIGFDKKDIIEIARKIGTFETSILPYEDCCTLFSPRHPLLKPDLARMQTAYERLEADDCLKKAVECAELIRC
ncbi:MAG: tRNA uracil 4-sulfurtransferase ThiI [Spirochaetota bacterium]